jgi:hypothetical protein
MQFAFVFLMLLLPALAAAQAPRVYIEPSETVDAGHAAEKAKHIDFGAAIAAALIKKKVPVTTVMEPEKAQWTIKTVSSQQDDTTGTKVAKLIFAGPNATFTQFEGSITVIDRQTAEVLYAYNVKKTNFKSAAESFAKHFNDDYLKKLQK